MNNVESIKNLIKNKKTLKDMFSAAEYELLGDSVNSIPFPKEIKEGVIYYSTLSSNGNTHELVENTDGTFFLRGL